MQKNSSYNTEILLALILTDAVAAAGRDVPLRFFLEGSARCEGLVG